MNSDLTITSEQVQASVPVMVFHIKGWLDGQSEEQFLEAARNAHDTGTQYLLINMSNLDMITKLAERDIKANRLAARIAATWGRLDMAVHSIAWAPKDDLRGELKFEIFDPDTNADSHDHPDAHADRYPTPNVHLDHHADLDRDAYPDADAHPDKDPDPHAHAGHEDLHR